MRPEAQAAVAAAMRSWANPSSPHAEGRAARAALEAARARIAAALDWPGEVILTSGASEAIAIGLRGSRPVHVGATEHDAVRRAAPGAEMLAVLDSGIVAPFVSSAGSIVAIQTANSETGVIQPKPLAAAIRLADASQTAGKLPLPDADMVVVSAHKLGGPPGIGALLVRDLGLLVPGGGQERGYRGGTENLPAAMGFAAALEAPRDWFGGMASLRDRLDAAVMAAGGVVIGGEAARIPTIASYAMPKLSAAAQLIRFDMQGFAVSAGSACSSGTLRASHVLDAMRVPADVAQRVVRVSFGWTTTDDDVARFAEAWQRLARA